MNNVTNGWGGLVCRLLKINNRSIVFLEEGAIKYIGKNQLISAYVILVSHPTVHS